MRQNRVFYCSLTALLTCALQVVPVAQAQTIQNDGSDVVSLVA